MIASIDHNTASCCSIIRNRGTKDRDLARRVALGAGGAVSAGRIRIGQDPRLVVRELAIRIPLESFRLFSHTLLVHWDTGGSLASSLRTVGRTVRDRLEVSRRINAQAIESQVSVVVVMALSYGLTWFMWNTNPTPVEKLLYSKFGSYAACGVMTLQAIGMVWIWRMSRIRF